MDKDIILGWFVINGVLASALGSAAFALWNHLAGKELRRLESRLRKDEETFRLAQSPRVAAATDLWIALRAYERAFSALLAQFQRIFTPDGATPADWDRLGEEHARAQRRDWRSAWKALGPARDRAEVPLPPGVFKLFDAVFGAYAKAHEEQEWLTFPGLQNVEEVRAKRDELIRAAGEHRPAALRALHAMMGTVESK